MDSTIAQATKQAYITHYQQPQHASRACLFAYHPVLRALHLFLHCVTMLDMFSIVTMAICMPSGAVSLAKRRTLDERTPNQRRGCELRDQVC